MEKPVIKNIVWGVDGVLADLNYAYYSFLTKHPKYAPRYSRIKWEDLPEVLPLAPEYGALDLRTNPSQGPELERDFLRTPRFYTNRPLYPNVIKTMRELDALGYKQYVLSVTADQEAEQKFLEDLLGGAEEFLTLDVVRHGKFIYDSEKERLLRNFFERHNLNSAETAVVDAWTYNHYVTLSVGGFPVRIRREFTIDLPENLKGIPEVKDLPEFKDWLLENTTQE